MNTYKSAGVDKEAGYEAVRKIKSLVAATHHSAVLNSIGSFGALYELSGYKEPVLVSGTDGVGTKLLIALETKNYASIGIDCFAMCANDILCHGAQPLFFLDYIACGKLDPQVVAEIVKGMAEACKDNKCALIGGETAEMPGMYQHGHYDVAGFCVGIVEKSEIIDGSSIQHGDKLIGLTSSGFHSNGYSLIRKIFTNFHEMYDGKPLYETLLTPTRLYYRSIFALKERVKIKGLAHITGGGLIENIPRILPIGCCAQISLERLPVPPIMRELQQRGKIETQEMLGTFNMGIGMVVVVNENDVHLTIEILESINEAATVIGEIIPSQTDEQIIFV